MEFKILMVLKTLSSLILSEKMNVINKHSRGLYFHVLVLMVLIFCLLLAFTPVSAQAKLLASDFTLSIDTKDHSHLRVDEIDEVINSNEFTLLEEGLKYSQGSPWLKVEWDKSKVHDEKYLINNFTSQAYEDYYLIKDDEVYTAYSSGLTDPFDIRPITHYKFVADVSNVDYILVKTCCNPGLPIYFSLLNEQELKEDYYYGLIWYAVVYSLITIMIVYNFFIYLYIRERQYLLYCYYLISMLLVLLSLSGLGKQFIWDGLPFIETFIFFMGLNTSIASILFQISFLDQKLLTAKRKRLMVGIVWLHVAVFLIYFLGFYVDEIERITNILTQLVGMSTWAAIYYVIIRNILLGDKLARILFLGYVIVTISGAIYMMRYNGYIPDLPWTERIVDVAVLCEALILSLALARKIQTLREEKSMIEEKRRVEQQEFSTHILQVQENEKKQLSSALHDNFTHQLLILKNSIKTKLGAESNENKQVEKILNEMRDLSHLVHPYLLEKLGLKAALTKVLNDTMKTYDLDINFACDELALSEEQSIVVYRIIQEAVNNIIKHAEATECLIAISLNNKKNKKQVVILIKDDGKGFNTSNSKGLGLKIIYERCQILNGKLKIISNQYGTEMNIQFPYSTTTGII